MRSARWMAVLGLLGVLACGDDDGRPEADAGVDAARVMPDGAADTGTTPDDDGGVDGGNVDEDGGTDGGVLPTGRLATLIEEAADLCLRGTKSSKSRNQTACNDCLQTILDSRRMSQLKPTCVERC